MMVRYSLELRMESRLEVERFLYHTPGLNLTLLLLLPRMVRAGLAVRMNQKPFL